MTKKGKGMISIPLALELKAAGLAWTPRLHDFFAIPDRGMDERLFVIGDILVSIERLRGEQLISFDGASEWALDYVLTGDSLWMPTEEQLRDLIEERLALAEQSPVLRLTTTSDGYCVALTWRAANQEANLLEFEAFGASDAYAKALLFILQTAAV